MAFVRVGSGDDEELFFFCSFLRAALEAEEK